ncbi:hypothetical protein [Streptomyces sp. NBC_00588]|uniref:hypothetical protein n=1 Tax=Streptomyces sp. NBC_00588 TaxID=2975784 RepID=UPI002E80F350|nr:hypothetical protein [Streptomyces sp. NBC_00588]WUB36645.1 hypothetical protein OHN38_17665 [Streptomyces sp. NBC_00588]
MRSLLAAILSLFLPPRGAHRTDAPPSLTHRPPAPAPRTGPRPLHVVSVDGQPLVRPYVVVWERERDERERERRRLAARTPQRLDRFPWEVAV